MRPDADWLPTGRIGAVCFSVDDVHPRRGWRCGRRRAAPFAHAARPSSAAATDAIRHSGLAAGPPRIDATSRSHPVLVRARLPHRPAPERVVAPRSASAIRRRAARLAAHGARAARSAPRPPRAEARRGVSRAKPSGMRARGSRGDADFRRRGLEAHEAASALRGGIFRRRCSRRSRSSSSPTSPPRATSERRLGRTRRMP